MFDPKSGLLGLFDFFRPDKSTKRQFFMLFWMAMLENQSKMGHRKMHCITCLLRYTVHRRVQIWHKSLSVVYYIKKRFLLIYLLTAGRSESEPCYINALCRGAITKAATTEIMVKIGVMQHKQLLVIKKVVALGRNFSERK